VVRGKSYRCNAIPDSLKLFCNAVRQFSELQTGGSNSKQEIPMHKYVLLTAVVLVAAGVGLAIKALTLAPLAAVPAPATVTISIEDIHRQVDVKSLPVLEVKEPMPGQP
jgi:hypothetical protein